jgi:glycine/D-amino acid oxidase-like deaminating enzyme
MQRSRIPGALGGAIYDAASFYPYRFVSHILRLLLSRHSDRFKAFTNTPVLRVSSAREVVTSRGQIQAEKVVYATNAWTSHLLPLFRGSIVPVRGQCSSVTPTIPYSGEGRLKTSYILLYDDSFDYLVIVFFPR